MIEFEISCSTDAPRSARWKHDIEKILKEANIDEVIIRYQKTGKKIFIGEIEEEYTKTPIENFKEVVKLFKSGKEHFEIHTNDPQVVELFEVLYGENNIDVSLISKNGIRELTFQQAYNYLGDLYDIIDGIRIGKQLNCVNEDNEYFTDIYTIDKDISEYEGKWNNLNSKND